MNRNVILVTIYYIIGTIGGLYFRNIISFLFIFFLIHSCIFKKKRLILLCIFFIASLKSYGTQCYIQKIEKIENYNVVGDVIRISEKEKMKIVELKANKINNNNCLIETKLKIYVNNGNIEVGDKVIVHGKNKQLSYTKNEGCFDYKLYLNSKGIYGYIESESIVRSKNDVSNYFIKFIEYMRKKIRASIYRYLPNTNAEICTALVIGEKESMDEDITTTFSEAGLSHIIAISGMHTVYVAYIALIFKNVIGKRKSYFFVVIALYLFCNIAYNSDSVYRAAIMLALFYLAKILYRKSDSLSNLFLATLIALVRNPLCINSPGFILSTAGTFGIITMYEQAQNKKNNKISAYIKNQVRLGLAANVILIPIIAKMYNKVSFTFFISSSIINFIMSILMPVVFLFSVLSIISYIIPTFFMKITALVVTFFTNILLFFASLFQKVDILNIQIVTPTAITIFVYYVFLFYIYLYRKKKSLNIRKKIKYVVVIYLCICVSARAFYYFDSNLKIYFVDVGQGDCTVIQTPHKYTILIDGGGNENGRDRVGSDIVIPFLLNKHIKKIDYMIISHFDSDHVGGLLTVLEKMNVKNVIIGKQGENCENYENFKRIVKQKRINVIVVKIGDRVTIEKDLYIDILWPAKDLIEDNILNNNSVVCKLNYKRFSILFMGDIEAVAEQSMISNYGKKSKVFEAVCLKAGHHGSKTSSTFEFIRMVNPKYVLIGVGVNNKFGHPNEEVIQRFVDIGANVYRTDENGEITIIVNKNGNIEIKKYINE